MSTPSPNGSTAPPGSKRHESVSTIEAAQQLGASVQTIQRWMDRGYLRGWRTPGGHRRVDIASVREVLQRATPVAVTAGAAAMPQVMIVDDSPDDLELLAAIAKAVLPHTSQVLIGNGFAALTTIGQTPPDLLITDISMPGIDGLEMLRSLREVPRFARLPVIVVSSLGEAELAARFGPAPADLKILRKPLTPAMLRAAVSDIVALRQPA